MKVLVRLFCKRLISLSWLPWLSGHLFRSAPQRREGQTFNSLLRLFGKTGKNTMRDLKKNNIYRYNLWKLVLLKEP